MALAVCTNHECERVLDVPGLPRTYRAPDGRCAKCAGLTPEQIMDIPAQVVAALKPIASRPQVERDVPLPAARHANRKKGTSWLPLAILGPPRADGSADSVLVPVTAGIPPESFCKNVRAAVNKYAKTYKTKYVTRANEDGSVRIWRIV